MKNINDKVIWSAWNPCSIYVQASTQNNGYKLIYGLYDCMMIDEIFSIKTNIAYFIVEYCVSKGALKFILLWFSIRLSEPTFSTIDLSNLMDTRD